jgi:hypothetical protein
VGDLVSLRGSARRFLAFDLRDPLPHSVHRLIVLADLVEDEIYPAALAMLDGSYWKEEFDPGPPEYSGGGGSFEVGGGD